MNRYLVSITRDIEVDAWNEKQAESLAIELDGRPGELRDNIEVKRLYPLTEALNNELGR